MNSSYIATVPAYPGLHYLLSANPSKSWDSLLADRIIPYLVNIWLPHYRLTLSRGQVAEVPLNQLFYLFDIGPSRLIAAWGLSRGRLPAGRPNRHIKSDPVSARPGSYSGDAIPRRFGGGTDISLNPQLGFLNSSLFRELETRAVKTPGCLYFTYWMYAEGPGAQTASRIQQGLLTRGAPPDIRLFEN